jgi:AraC family transcriptional regulator of adaptative response / DNA-3-methyladenine glycosylase II
VHHDFDRCYRAVRARDARFDGWFVTAVRTTGIYCRPSCPARLPGPGNVSFFPTAAAAQQAGYRACKRCRPDASPGSPEWNARADVVARAMRLIADGTVDREGVHGVATRVGYSTRQLERHLAAELGAGPLALARAQRAQTARVLIETTDLPFGQVAFAAGFSSIRQFNDTVRATFAATPTALRGRRGSTPARPQTGTERAPATRSEPTTIELRLAVRQPFAAEAVIGHLATAAVPGCEELRGDTFRRTLRLAHGTGIAALTPRGDHVGCRLVLDDLRDLPGAIAGCRRLLDLDADPAAIDDALAGDPALRRSVLATPGRRIPRCVDGAELALRVVLGQQVSVRAARTHAERLARAFGTRVHDPDGRLTHAFPGPEDLAAPAPAALAAVLAMPASRRRALASLAQELAAGSVDLGPGADWDRARAHLVALEGIGPWTAEVVAMRGLGDPDAFPPTDLGVRRGARVVGLDDRPASITRRAERWRPWRAYAVQHLWSTAPRPEPARGAPR